MTPHLSWAVGAVADRVGLSASTLRSWDRRYGVGPSDRTDGNHRRYNHVDVLRVLTMARLTAQGVSAQAAAAAVLEMGEDDLGAQHRQTVLVGDPEPALVSRGLQADSHPAVQAITAAARALDSATLSHVYRQTLRQLEVGDAWTTVLAPALRLIGELWAEGQIGIEAEHLASEMLGTELRALTRSASAGLRVAGSPILLSSADEEQHHLPVLALEAELVRRGHGCTFLGARVPASALAQAILRTGSERAFLWASIPRPADEPLWAELAASGVPLRLVVGGPGWAHDLPVQGPNVTLLRADDFPAAVDALTAD